MTREVRACPHCDSTDIRIRPERSGRGGLEREDGSEGTNWRCNDCKVVFSEPLIREPYRHAPPHPLEDVL